MAISRLAGQDASGTGTTAATATYPGATTAGNLLIAIVGSLSATQAAISTVGWTILNRTSGATINAGIFYKVAAGTETAIGATGATTTAIAVFEYSGLANPAFTDGTAASLKQTATATAVNTPNITTQNPSDLLFSAAFVANAPNPTSGLAWGVSTLIGLNTAGNVKLVGGEKIVSTNQSGYWDTLTWTGAVSSVSLIAAFQTSPAYQPMGINNYQFVKVGDGMSVSEKIR